MPHKNPKNRSTAVLSHSRLRPAYPFNSKKIHEMLCAVRQSMRHITGNQQFFFILLNRLCFVLMSNGAFSQSKILFCLHLLKFVLVSNLNRNCMQFHHTNLIDRKWRFRGAATLPLSQQCYVLNVVEWGRDGRALRRKQKIHLKLDFRWLRLLLLRYIYDMSHARRTPGLFNWGFANWMADHSEWITHLQLLKEFASRKHL